MVLMNLQENSTQKLDETIERLERNRDLLVKVGNYEKASFFNVLLDIAQQARRNNQSLSKSSTAH